MSIFIAIPSYCDPVLGFTMAQAYEKASDPDGVYFGIVDQSWLDTPSLIPSHIPAKQVASIRLDASQARGCSWARNLAGSLYKDQDWYLQLDSHMMFEQDWDQTLVKQATACEALAGNPCVVSSYPENFRFVDGQPVPVNHGRRLLATLPRAGTAFGEKHPLLYFSSYQLFGPEAVEGLHIAGGCVFAPGDYVQRIPPDPYLYFAEEEQNLSLRLYTHGWSIYHVRGMPIYHLYNRENSGVQRELHWERKVPDATARKLWWVTYDKRSKRRLSTLLWGNADELGVYGLGKNRTLQDYARETGIDYPNRVIEERAFTGPWQLDMAIAAVTR